MNVKEVRRQIKQTLDREKTALINPTELFTLLQEVIEQNNILSVYLELIISLLYYDEDGILYRYSNKEISNQVALKNIIEVLDPKLGIFYNFSNIFNIVFIDH